MDRFLDQFFALIPNLRSDLASVGSICPQSASKDRQFGLAARRDLHYVRARRCDAAAARAEPWHAMVPLMHVYTAKYTMYIAILYLQVLIVEVHLYLLVLLPIPSFKIGEHPREAKTCNVVSTRSTIKSCAVLERRY